MLSSIKNWRYRIPNYTFPKDKMIIDIGYKNKTKQNTNITTTTTKTIYSPQNIQNGQGTQEHGAFLSTLYSSIHFMYSIHFL